MRAEIRTTDGQVVVLQESQEKIDLLESALNDGSQWVNLKLRGDIAVTVSKRHIVSVRISRDGL